MLKLYMGHVSLVEKPEVFEETLEMLKESRKNKVLACKQPEDKNRSLLAGLLLKQAVEKEGMDYETLEFGVTPEGKPVLLSEPDFYFSLSHTGDYVACVVADKPVGVDMECAERDIFKPENQEKLDGMAQKCLSEAEMNQYQSVPVEEKNDLFIKYWTRKEAYSKAVGKGLGMDFSTIDTEAEIAFFKSEWGKEGYMLSICMMN